MYDIITIGSSTVDVFASTKFPEITKINDSKEEKRFIAYPVGAKILIDELNFTTGGGATNTAVSLSRLGNKVACISKMGAGANAEKVIRHLKRDKVDTSLIVRKKNARTGYSVILDSLEHDRTILAFKGSNNDLRFSEIKLGKLKTKWFYFSTMMGESFKTLEKLANFAKSHNIKIAFNTSQYLAKKGPKFLKNILSKTELFILNKEEAHLIAGKGEIKVILKKLHKMGPSIVVITDYKYPVNIYNGEYFYQSQPRNIKAVETTGAGDAFASAFLCGLIKKDDIEFALKLAMANAESVITHHGAKNKLLTYKEALKAMNKHKVVKFINNQRKIYK